MMTRERPVVIYDGDCGFCATFIARLRRITGSRVDYVPAQRAATEFPEVPPAEFGGSVQFFDGCGRRWDRAAAVFRIVGTAWALGRALAWAHARVPGFGATCDFFYGLVARNRGRLSRVLGTPSCRRDEGG